MAIGGASVSTPLDADEVEAVRELVRRVTAADGIPPLSEHTLLHLQHGGDAEARNLLIRDERGQLIGYAHLDVTDVVAGSSAEVAVDPDRRRTGIGRALVEAVLAQTPDGRLRLWAHGDTPAAAALGARLGFRRGRVLLQLRRPLTGTLPQPVLPAGVSLRTFVPGQDEAAWTELNARAFARHPDQGRWGVHEVELREKEQWFDPGGFFLAERAGRLVGFHWTKVHGGHPDSYSVNSPHDHPPIGEVYIVGVDPAEHGQGLGTALTLVGLRSLQERGLADVLLYVDEDNVPAVKTYERLGFTRHSVDVMYSRP